VRQTWSRFFDANTPLSDREAALEDGRLFGSVLARQSAAGPIRAHVNRVSFTDKTHASVTFSLTIGRTRFPSISGAAVFWRGSWRVSKSTLCALLAASRQRASACS
jgi:hypothetical protein